VEASGREDAQRVEGGGREAARLGAIPRAADAELDDAVARMPAIEGFLRQDPRQQSPFDEAVAALAKLVR